MANPTGSNIFKSWSINGTYDIQNSKTTSDAEITLVVNSDITATASFTQAAPYQVAYDVKNSVNKRYQCTPLIGRVYMFQLKQ